MGEGESRALHLGDLNTGSEPAERGGGGGGDGGEERRGVEALENPSGLVNPSMSM